MSKKFLDGKTCLILCCFIKELEWYLNILKLFQYKHKYLEFFLYLFQFYLKVNHSSQASFGQRRVIN